MLDTKEDSCFICKNYEGRSVVFTKKQFDKKSKVRPELRESGVQKRMIEVIGDPEFVYEDYEKPGIRYAYYTEEYSMNGRSKYMKIALSEYNGNDFDLFVITAFRPDYIKEKDKTKLLYEKHN